MGSITVLVDVKYAEFDNYILCIRKRISIFLEIYCKVFRGNDVSDLLAYGLEKIIHTYYVCTYVSIGGGQEGEVGQKRQWML